MSPRAPPPAATAASRGFAPKAEAAPAALPQPKSPPVRGRASLIGTQYAHRFRLRVFHRLLRRLGAGQRRLDAVVERLGDALIVVSRQFRDSIFELVARHG